MRDIVASLLSEGVSIEPHLQPLSGETMAHNCATTQDLMFQPMVSGVAGLKFKSIF